MFFSFLVHKIASTITVGPAVSFMGEDVGAYDISGSGTIRGNTITRDGSGVFCQINVGGIGKALTYPGPTTNNDLSTTIQADINDDSVVMKYIVKNTGSDTKTFSLGSYYDLNYADTTDDSIVQAGSNIFYAVRWQELKLFHILDSTDTYIGPDRYWYGESPDISDGSSILANYYYRSSSSGLETSGDLGVAFSFNDISIGAGETKTLGIKFAFLSNTPDISFDDPGNDAYKIDEDIEIRNVKVTNSQKGTIKFDYNGTTLHSIPYTETPSVEYLHFKQPSGMKYRTEKYCIQVYAEAEIQTPKRDYCFVFKNEPELKNVQTTAVPGKYEVKITGIVDDKDEGKKLYLYAKIDGTTSSNYERGNFVSNGQPHEFSFILDVTNQQGEIHLKVWASSERFSTDTSDEPYYSKSEIKELTYNVPAVTVPILKVNFPVSTNAFQRNQNIPLTGSVSGGSDLTMKFLIDDQEIGTTKQVSEGDFNINFEIPNTVSLDSHSLKVYVEGSNGKSAQSDAFQFTVKNTLPTMSNIVLAKNSVIGGEQVTITGNIQDIDPDNEITIKAKHGDDVFGETMVRSNGQLQEFTIQFTAADVTEETQYQITITANDGTDTLSSYDNLQLTITVAKPTFTVEFPNPNKFPRNKKLHLTGTASGKGGLTMKFIIDDHEMKKTQTVTNDAFDFNLDLPNGIKIGSHKLIVYIVDEKQRKSDNSTVYSFNVENSHPVIEDLSVTKHKVESGEKVTIKGKIQDIDAGSHVTITAKNGDKELSHTTVESDGTMQPFTIEITAEEVTSETTFSITIEANDGTDTYTSDTKIILTVSSKEQNPQPQPQPDPDPNPNPEPTNTDDALTEAELEKQKQKQKYIIIGVVVGLLVFIAIIAIIAFVVIKKKGSNTTMTEGGYQKDESFEP